MSPTEAALSPILRALEGASGRSSRRPGSKADRRPDTFCAEGHLPIDALMVSVNDLGPLPSPLPPATAQALHAASTPARHGRRDKTLLDKRVRDSGELRADMLDLCWTDGVSDALQAEVESNSRYAPHDGQNQLRLQLNASNLSWPHSAALRSPRKPRLNDHRLKPVVVSCSMRARGRCRSTC